MVSLGSISTKLIRIEMQLVMQAANCGDLPPRLTAFTTDTQATRTGLRGVAGNRAPRATGDPALLNSLKAVWNTLTVGQRTSESRQALKRELRDGAIQDYVTNCVRPNCWDCQRTREPEETRRRLNEAQRTLRPEDLRRILTGQNTYEDFGL